MKTAPQQTDHRSPLAKARDEWLASDEGRRCLNEDILSSHHFNELLENRLVTAFLAGAAWAKDNQFNGWSKIDLRPTPQPGNDP